MNSGFYFKKRKKELISVFNNKCCICGFDKFQQALEFHHVNQDEKELNLSQGGTLEKQLSELKKCVLVCANCHRGIHVNILKVPDNWQELYSQEVADELLNNLKRKKKFCKICGNEISINATYCKNCVPHKRVVEERPTREELKQKIRNQTFISIAREYNVSDNAIRKWCKKYNLPSKKREIDSYSNEKWETL